MSLHRDLGLSTLLISILASVGCANAEDVSFAPGYDAGAKVDTAEIDTGSVVEDTGSVVEDTGTKKDTAVAVDTGSAVDSSTSDSATAVDSVATDSTISDSGASDSSTIDSSTSDSSTVDSSVADSALADSASGDTSDETGSTTTRLVSGTVTLHGVTTDGYVVYSDSASTTYAVALTGGTPQTIGTSTTRVLLSGKAAFAWSTLDGYGFGSLRVWTAVNGAKAIATKSLAPSSTAAYAFYVAAASADGQYAMYTDGGVGGVSDKADVKLVKTDGTGVKTVFTQYVVYDGSTAALNDYCAPYLGWVGTRFVTSHCTPVSSTVSFDASSIDPAVGTATSLGTSLGNYWAADDAGTKVALITSAGSLRLLPIAGGTAMVVDSGVASAMFTHDGTYVLYRTSLNALKRSPTASASPSTLVSSGVATILSGVSPNDKFVLYSSATTAGAYNVRLASTTTAGTGTVLYATSGGDVYGDAFTADSSHALYYQSVVSEVGTLTAQPTAGGSGITLGTSAWINWATTGSKVVWNDGYSSTTGRATIRTRDLSSLTGTIVTIAADADRNFVLTPGKDRVVYTLSGGTSDGLWTAVIP